jgi:nucleotide-binding universal stress UspA family protein
MYRKLLIPTDGSPVARRAVLSGIRLARALGARVTALHVTPPVVPLQYRGLIPVRYVEPETRARAIEQSARRHLAYAERAARAARVPFRGITIVSDFPAEAIVAAAQREKCDLIFMGSHGRRGFHSSLLGSQTQKVLSMSRIPVLVHR